LLAGFLVFVCPACLHAADDNAPDNSGWTVALQSQTLTIHHRKRKDSEIQEIRATGIIDARPLIVRRVIDDTEEYPKFMPYVKEARILSRQGAVLIGYQRLSIPLIHDRDCTLRIHCETRRTQEGETSYCNRWEAANELGPAEKPGVSRIRVNEGSWLLEPLNNGSQTRATYTVYSDSGGSLPAGLVNAANRTAVPRLFESVRKQARNEKYLSEKSPIATSR